jgi:hypothetical protein
MSYQPTITYGKAWQDDGNDLSPLYTWTEKGTGDGDTTDFIIENNDYFRIPLSFIGGDASVYWEYPDSAGADNLLIDTDDYPNIMWRYKGMPGQTTCAKIELVFDGGGTQIVLNETHTETLTVGTATIDAGERLDHVRLYATTGVGLVFYDFLMVYKGTFTFPKADVHPYWGNPAVSQLGVRKGGGVPQDLGGEWSRIHITAEMTHESTADWGSPKGKYLKQILHEQPNDLWQWLTLPSHDSAFKARIPQPIEMPYVNGKLNLDLWLEEYKLGATPPSTAYSITETSDERFGHS